MRSTTHRFGLGIVVSVIVALAIPSHATASTMEHVNLGDSFSTGNGVLPLAPNTPLRCLQSQRNFAHLVAREQGYSLTDVSCGGAATDDFYAPHFEGTRPQFDALSPSAHVVTLMIGGNDNSVFSGASAACMSALATHAGAFDPCTQQNGSSFDDKILDKTLPAVRQALRDIHTRALEAKMIIIGYPWLMPAASTCEPSVPVTRGDVPYLRNLQATLNDAIREAAADTDTTFLDMSVASEGHDACQPVGVRWVEPLLFADQFVPLHPNSLGEAAIAAEVTEALTA
ncbi:MULTISPECIES: SGNH/GDSL hydrolase family protein [unclassified Rhodococcus (in: high G+C Gram-positive bacteria)]|uniref:SGNH/GDSL hydrolase family protein n=1 Tax=unclassified Rhodococcus (in: high G+C Gram-positive bacteria) TaxID=192944 RepID=UPI00070E532F|nr:MULTISPECIES: SGNH/GDSL hydrolase family protein [unclassified Rhodococcus (in: high G+C Gram-positive bacteria)]KQU32967.1 lipase [Rhodococcus sp. Leaf233]OZD07881.1 SGNH/GDSL hydrolase family protein [Rhodococcus sp. 06-221-2]